MGITDGDVRQKNQSFVLRPVVGLAEGLPRADLELITVDAIKKHRWLRDLATAREEQWRTSLAPSASSCCDTIGAAGIAYINAMIDMHAQQAVLSTLLDVLGYVPNVPMTE